MAAQSLHASGYYKIFHDHSRPPLVLEAGAMGGRDTFWYGQAVKIIDLRKMIKLAGFIPDKDIMIKIVGLRPGEKL
jgi:FlaA1/EpsC-like NDP-sugar epimerase